MRSHAARDLDETRDARAVTGRDPEPVPSPLDHLPEGRDGDAAAVLIELARRLREEPEADRLPPPPDPHGEVAVDVVRAGQRYPLAVDPEADAQRIERA